MANVHMSTGRLLALIVVVLVFLLVFILEMFCSYSSVVPIVVCPIILCHSHCILFLFYFVSCCSVLFPLYLVVPFVVSFFSLLPPLFSKTILSFCVNRRNTGLTLKVLNL